MNTYEVNVADLSPKECEKLIEKYKKPADVAAYQMQKEMARRFADHNKQKEHPTQTLNVHGENVEIDVDMVPVIKWLNNIPGVFTTFCCQGDVDENNDGKHKKPYVLFYSNQPARTEYIIKTFTEFHQHSMTLNVMHSYHEVKTTLDWFMNGIRYSAHWYDNMSLKDFIKWAGLE